jgi:uncharacterized protein DUF5684
LLLLLFQDDSSATAAAGALAAFSGMFLLFMLAIAVVAIIAMWRVFEKAGQPGWAAIVPIYNVYILTQIAGRPAWWIVLFFIPVANVIAGIVISIDVAKAFGQSAAWGVILLFIFALIGYLMLAFGNYRYTKPVMATA